MQPVRGKAGPSLDRHLTFPLPTAGLLHRLARRQTVPFLPSGCPWWSRTGTTNNNRAGHHRASLVAQTVKNLPANAENAASIPGLGRYPGGGNGNLTPVFLPGISHRQRGLASYSPRGRKETRLSDSTTTSWSSHLLSSNQTPGHIPFKLHLV